MQSSIIALQAVLSICIVGTTDVNSDTEDDTVEMRRYRCGYNSVYVLLRLSGLNIDYNEIKINRNSGEEGVSMMELVDELSRCGLPAHAIQCREQNEIRDLNPPFIIYTNPDRRGKTIGHFLVVTRVDATTIDLIDGTTGETTLYVIDKLENLWDGYAILPTGKHIHRWQWMVGVFLAIGGVIFVYRSVMPSRRP